MLQLAGLPIPSLDLPTGLSAEEREAYTAEVRRLESEYLDVQNTMDRYLVSRDAMNDDDPKEIALK
jgi:hypothetical protein